MRKVAVAPASAPAANLVASVPSGSEGTNAAARASLYHGYVANVHAE